jgi:hypothetical protein
VCNWLLLNIKERSARRMFMGHESFYLMLALMYTSHRCSPQLGTPHHLDRACTYAGVDRVAAIALQLLPCVRTVLAAAALQLDT